MREMKPYDPGYSLEEAERHNFREAEETTANHSSRETEASQADQDNGEAEANEVNHGPWVSDDEERPKQDREGVPGWPKSWPRWLVSLFSAVCLFAATYGINFYKSYNEQKHWFDGVEEAGFHAEAQRTDGAEPFVWIGKVGELSDDTEPEEDGHHWYKLSQGTNNLLAALDRYQMKDNSVMVCSKTPIRRGPGGYVRIEGHPVGHYTIRYAKSQQTNSSVITKYNKLSAYEADKVSSGTYLEVAYPYQLTKVAYVSTQAEGFTLTLEKIQFREGMTLCFLRIKNQRTDGKTALLRMVPGAIFKGQPLLVDSDDWEMAMRLSSIEQLRVESNRQHSSFAFYRTVNPGEEAYGALAMDAIQGEGELELEFPVELQPGDENETVELRLVYPVQWR